MRIKIKAFVVDLDGTIMCGGHRLHLMPPKDMQHDTRAWDEFNLACIDDTPLADTITMITAMVRSGYIPIFITGRNEIARENTVLWLERNLPWFDRNVYQVIMRSIDDHGSPVECKVNKIIEVAHKYDLLFAIDDDHAIIRALRDNNIQAWEVRCWQENQ